MSLVPLAPIAASGLVVAMMHAALPTHWLPFVLVGRAHGWAGRKVMAVAAAAGSGHVLFTLLLGLVLTTAGIAVEPRLGQLFPRLVGALIVGLGLFYILAHFGRKQRHHHADPTAKLSGRTDAAAIAGLIVLLTFSPCEVFLPLFLTNVRFGWAGFLLLAVVLAAGTFAAMLGLTALCLAGADGLKLERLGRYESALIGVVLCGLGMFVVLES